MQIAARSALSRTFAISLMVASLLVAFAMSAWAAEVVRTRGWSHTTYGRIIFDWPKPVTFDAKIDGATLTVKFARPMDADLDRVLKYLSGYVTGAQLSSDGRTATFALAGLFDLDSFSSGNSVILDLRRGQAAVEERPRDAKVTMLRVRVGRHPGFTRLVFDWLDPVDYRVSRDGSKVTMIFAQSGTIDVAALDSDLPKPAFGTPMAHSEGKSLVLDLQVPEQSYIRHFRDDAKIVLDIQEEGGDFGGMVAADPGQGGMVMQAISPSGELLVIPAMVGTTVAIERRIPLVTENVAEMPAEAVSGATPMSLYDLNANGVPRNLLLYPASAQPRPSTANGG